MTIIPDSGEFSTRRMRNNMRFMLERSDFGATINVFVATTPNEHGKVYVAKSVTFHELDENEAYANSAEAPLQLNQTSAQQLMDELWRCGLRPTEGTGSAGSLAATERHLADMQRIAFSLMRDEQQLGDMARAQGNSAINRSLT